MYCNLQGALVLIIRSDRLSVDQVLLDYSKEMHFCLHDRYKNLLGLLLQIWIFFNKNYDDVKLTSDTCK